jgi:hypothetical protein
VAKALLEHCDVGVSSTEVYNKMRKWRVRWLTISKLRDLSGAQWCEESKCIHLEAENYRGHVAVSTIPSTIAALSHSSLICTTN